MAVASQQDRNIEALLAPVVEGMGYRLVRLSFSGGSRGTLQVMAERPDGSMSVDDCASLSRELSAVLDIEDPIAGEYTLEVSSPGIDRPLTRLEDFETYRGFEAKLVTAAPIDGRKRFRGVLEGLEDGNIILGTEEGPVAIPFAGVAKAKLVLTDALLAAHGA